MKYIASALIFISASISVFSLFYYELNSLPFFYKSLLSGLAVISYVVFWSLLRNYITSLGPGKIAIVALSAFLGIFLSSQLAATPSADNASHATLEHSDGTFEENIKPQRIELWGHIYNGYFLHPAYNEVRVVNSIVANFLTRPKKITILFSKPKEALLLPDGTPTLSDGISINISATDSFGEIGYSQSISLTQDDFLDRHWIKKKIKLPLGISKITIKVTSGPPGSTPYYDSTLVAFEGKGVSSYVVAIGRSVLVGMAISVIMLAVIRHIRPISIPRNNLYTYSSLILVAKRLAPFLLLCFVILAVVSRSINNSSHIYFWDYRNYWEKTEIIYSLISSWSWMQATSSIIGSYSSDYTLLPAVIPALLSLILGYPTKLNYALCISIVYALPAYIMISYLSKQIFHSCINTNYDDAYNLWAYTGFVVLFFVPSYLGIVMLLMPDIGGVALYCVAILLSSDIVKYITCCDPYELNESEKSEVICKCLMLGIIMSAMFLFRRWYVFAIVGIVGSCVIIVIITSLVNYKQMKCILKRLTTSVVLVGSSAMLMLIWVIFEWSKNIGQHDYSKLYSSYQRSLTYVLEMSIEFFGIIVPIIVAVFIIMIMYCKYEKRILSILCLSSIIACVLFLKVQSPGRHHFYLLMPLIGVCLSGASLVLFKKIGHVKFAIIFVITVIGLIVFDKSTYATYDVYKLFPGYDDWIPRQQVYANGYKQISAWLLKPENQKLRFCVVASSVHINQGVFAELWQLEPAIDKHSFVGRLVYLGEVDSRDGPPVEGIKLCEIALVGTPVQTHLKTSEQHSVQILQEDLVNGSGVGAAFERAPMTFVMDEYTKIHAYKRARLITNDEYADLVKRYLEYKAKTVKGTGAMSTEQSEADESG